MSQQNWKMMAMVEKNYTFLNELRIKYGTSFNDVVSKLIELYQKQVPQKECSSSSVSQVVQGFAATNQPDQTTPLAQTPPTAIVEESVAPNDHRQRTL